MKKGIPAALALTAVLGLCSCGSPRSELRVSIPEGTECRITENNKACRVRISYVSEDTSTLTVIEPSELSGLSLRQAGNSFSLSLGGLICRGDQPALPESSVLLKAMNAIKKLNSLPPDTSADLNADGGITCEASGFSFQTDGSGKLTELNF